jgi:hypothetical protein
MQPQPSTDDLLIGNDNGVEIDRLYDKFDDDFEYDNGAAVTLTLLSDYRDAGGEIITTLTMPNVAASGKYRGVLLKSLPLVHGVTYVQEIKVVMTSGSEATWETERTARRRVT